MTCACPWRRDRHTRVTITRTSSSTFLLGAGMAACCVMLLCLGDLKERIALCIVVFLCAFALYCVLLAVLKTFAAGTTGVPASALRRELGAILAFALLFRLILLFSPPSLSDDIYRYVWEGRLVAAGLNPFAHAPDAPELIHLRDATLHPRINHREYSAIYPPFSLGLFGLTAQMSPTVRAMNATVLLFDVLTVLVLLRILHTLQLDPRRVAVYAWNPLVLIEFAGSGHVDSAGIFFLMLALYLSLKQQVLGSSLALACGFLCKFLPVLLLPWMNLPRKHIAAACIIAAAAVFYLPFLNAGGKLLESLAVYGHTWTFNASLYELVRLAAGDDLHARLIAWLLFAALMTILWRHRTVLQAAHGSHTPFVLGLMLIGALIALSPVVHPWYVCWLVPLAAVRPSRAAVLLSGTVFLSYLVLRGYAIEGIWQEHPAVQCAVYIPVYFVLVAEVLARRCRKQTAVCLH